METIKELLVKIQKFNEERKAIHKAPAMKYLRDEMDREITVEKSEELQEGTQQPSDQEINNAD